MRYHTINLDIQIYNTPFDRIGSYSYEKSTKYLGFLIDELLTWKIIWLKLLKYI